jgi:hypothetical protein
MKHNVKFFTESRKDKNGIVMTENVPLFAAITFGGDRLFYFTGYRIDRDKFDKEKQQANKNSSGTEGNRLVQYNTINDRINAIRSEMELYFQRTDKADKEKIKTILDKACKKAKPKQVIETSFIPLFELFIESDKVSQVKKKHFRSVLNHWRRYSGVRNITIDFDTITVERLRDFEKYLRTGCLLPASSRSKELITTTIGKDRKSVV